MLNIKPGQTVYFEDWGNRYTQKSNRELEPVVIETVGKKYFTVRDKYRMRFHLDSGVHDGGEYSARAQIYLNKQEVLDRNEKRDLLEYIPRHLSDLSLEELRTIKQLITNKTNQTT